MFICLLTRTHTADSACEEVIVKVNAPSGDPSDQFLTPLMARANRLLYTSFEERALKKAAEVARVAKTSRQSVDRMSLIVSRLEQDLQEKQGNLGLDLSVSKVI